jgi:cardiolipin hydrolase
MNARTAPTTLLLLATICWPSTMLGQQITVHFSPNAGCAAAVIREIDAATTSIDVAMYILSYKPIGERLAAARARGVTVRIILDRVQEVEPTPVPVTLRQNSILLRTDRTEKLFHNKYAIIDNAVLITGSYNWSDNAEHANAENLIIIRDSTTTAAFAADFARHWQHSVPFALRHPRRNPKPTPRAFSNPSPHAHSKGP